MNSQAYGGTERKAKKVQNYRNALALYKKEDEIQQYMDQYSLSNRKQQPIVEFDMIEEE